ncbi:hypothetical protein JKP88DRAFT_272404 [Tribonema minus]|uniref:Uncharacterized protein n=1 Tax=Tribonema minus TaxID=303371 RepID=A0A835ZG19_9STRA|nr:hypothetical protein JKP88DRAFT_272404 [Tribonema minus]
MVSHVMCLLSACLLLATTTTTEASSMSRLLKQDGTSTGVDPLMTGQNGWVTKGIYTVGDALPDGNPYVPAITPDGIGAWRYGDVVKVVYNHEVGNTYAGPPYVVNGGLVLPGARMTYLDLDANTRRVIGGGQAYTTVYDPHGDLLSTPTGFDRYCSAVGAEAKTYGLEDDILFAGEESSGGRGGIGGYMVALDVKNSALHMVPAVGHAAYESATPMEQFKSDKVIKYAKNVIECECATPMEQLKSDKGEGTVKYAKNVIACECATPMEQLKSDKGEGTGLVLLIGDDQSPGFFAPCSSPLAPLKIYIGEKGRAAQDTRSADGDFLRRNGLAYGRLFTWVPSDNVGTTQQTWATFKGTGTQKTGKFVPLDTTCTGPPETGTGFGCDSLGYPSAKLQNQRAAGLGAFGFYRIEDVGVDPKDGSRAVFAVTGGQAGGNVWGTLMMLDAVGLESVINMPVDDITEFAANVKIVHDGNDSNGASIRSNDNVAWADDGTIYAFEDRTTPVPFCGPKNGNREASVWSIADNGDGATATSPKLVATMNRAALAADDAQPGDCGNWESTGGVEPGDCGNWESTGGVEVSKLFAHAIGDGDKLLLLNVQAHSAKEKGQLLFAEYFKDHKA